MSDNRSQNFNLNTHNLNLQEQIKRSKNNLYHLNNKVDILKKKEEKKENILEYLEFKITSHQRYLNDIKYYKNKKSAKEFFKNYRQDHSTI